MNALRQSRHCDCIVGGSRLSYALHCASPRRDQATQNGCDSATSEVNDVQKYHSSFPLLFSVKNIFYREICNTRALDLHRLARVYEKACSLLIIALFCLENIINLLNYIRHWKVF